MVQEAQQGISRTTSVLEALGQSKTGGMRASEICRAVGLGASTVARLLTSLEEFDFVTKDSETQLYSIGPAIYRLSSQGLNQNPVHRESRIVAESLAQQTGLSVNVAILRNRRAMYLCHFEGNLAPKEHTMVGMTQPLHASAMGKCLLLDMSEQELKDLLGDGPLDSYTTNTITEIGSLKADLSASISRGYCIENQELALGRFCIACPIRGADGLVVASMSISGRLSILRERDLDDLAEQLIEYADRVSVGLGMISSRPIHS